MLMAADSGLQLMLLLRVRGKLLFVNMLKNVLLKQTIHTFTASYNIILLYKEKKKLSILLDKNCLKIPY